MDGLRAVAIVPVVIFHLGATWLPGGFLGVDVFFVISGYLISSLISLDLDRGTFSFAAFWARRVRRILPALLVSVLAALLAARYLVTPVELASVARDALSAAFSYANVWMFAKVGDYWGTAAEGSPFLHAWSLSVEEQFYLVFPLLLWILAKLRARRAVALGIATLLGFALFALLARYHPTFAFYMLPARAWELLLGAFTAAAAPLLMDRLRDALSVGGLLTIVGGFFWMNGEQGINTWLAAPVLGTAAVLASSDRPNLANAVLGSAPMVLVGKLSYSLYLWHWVVIVLSDMLEVRTGAPLATWQLVGAMLLGTVVSHYLVEKPARAWRGGVGLAVALLLVTAGVSASFIRRASDPQVAGDLNPVVSYSAYYDATPKKEGRTQIARVNPIDPALGVWSGVIGKVPDPAFADAWKNGGIPGGTGRYGGRADVVVVGDSHGCMWGKTIDEVANELGLAAAFFTFDGNVPYFPIPVRDDAPHGAGFDDEMFRVFSLRLLKNIDDWKPSVVILTGRWETKSRQDFRNIAQLAEYARKASARVLFITSPPRLPWNNASTAQSLVLRGFKAREGEPQYVEVRLGERFEKARKRLNELIESIPGARKLDPFEKLYLDGKAQVLQGGDVLYVDDDHLSYDGTSLFRATIKAELEPLSKR